MANWREPDQGLDKIAAASKLNAVALPSPSRESEWPPVSETLPKYLVISSSLHPQSRSRVLAQAAYRHLQCLTAAADPRQALPAAPDKPGSAARANGGAQNHSATADISAVGWLDLAQIALPLCDGFSAYRDPAVGQVTGQIAQARGILVASPIYNFDVNATLKNLVELTSRAWQDKVVGLLCAAGGVGSYMSLMPFANSLMLDFRCLILPRFVYTTGQAFTADGIQDSEVERRVGELAERLLAVTEALPPPPSAEN